MSEAIRIEPFTVRELENWSRQDCIDRLQITTSSRRDPDLATCISNLVLYSAPRQRNSLRFRSTLPILFNNELIDSVELPPNISHFFWCKRDNNLDEGLDVYVSHNYQDHCEDLFNDLKIFPQTRHILRTISIKRWNRGLESEELRNGCIGRPVPISPPYLSTPFHIDRISFPLPRYGVIDKTRSNILHHLSTGLNQYDHTYPIYRHPSATHYRLRRVELRRPENVESPQERLRESRSLSPGTLKQRKDSS